MIDRQITINGININDRSHCFIVAAIPIFREFDLETTKQTIAAARNLGLPGIQLGSERLPLSKDQFRGIRDTHTTLELAVFVTPQSSAPLDF